MVRSESILSVDSFLNHQVDSEMIGKIGEAIAERFEDEGVTRVVTAAASGIAIAYATSRELNRRSSHDVYSIYAKKGIPETLRNGITRKIESPTGKGEVELAACRDYLKGERVLITDDFLFSGATSEALTEICEEAEATVIGYAFAISKEFSEGRDRLAKHGHPIFVLARVKDIDGETGEIRVE